VYVWVLQCVGVYMYGLCNVWLCVFVGFVMCGCFDNSVGVLVISVLVFTVFCDVCTCFWIVSICLYILICFVFTSIRTTATE
jgi:hypothetical protein